MLHQIYWLEQIKLQDRTNVGEKAFHLSRIMQHGYPVVPGFVVSAEIWREFLETLNSSEALIADLPHSSLYLDVKNWRQLRQVASRLRQAILTATVPPDLIHGILAAARIWEAPYLILRPTLVVPATQYTKHHTENISGLLDSQICCCQPEAITQALKQCWSQIFRARSLLYWQWAGVDLREVSLGVLVQPIKNARASGLLKVHPSRWEVQATVGLGLTIAHGEVLPDVHYIQPQTGTVQEQQIGYKMIAYRLDEQACGASWPSASTSQVSHPIHPIAYLLDEAQQQQYALSEENLQQIIQLASQLVTEMGTTFVAKWTIIEESNREKLYLTQMSAPQVPISNLYSIKGLGAAAGRVTGIAYNITNGKPKSNQIPNRAIFVATTITPDWLPWLQKSVGIITEQGGLTSHAAILARELGIPAVISVVNATSILRNGEQLLVDGDRGEVYRLSIDDMEGEKDKWREPETQKAFSTPSPSPNIDSPTLPILPPQPMTATQLFVNLSQPGLIEQARNLPVDGVGLLRSELMAMNVLKGQHPQTWLQEGHQTRLLECWREQILQFVRAFAPRPVFYRSLDWREHEFSFTGYPLQHAHQSMLGERGTFNYLGDPTLFEMELTALADLQKAGYENLYLLLPFVRTVEEFSFCRQKVEQAGLTQSPQFQLWIMAEVPSVLFLLPEYVKAGVQGISIGTNDLTQLLLGVDREQGQLAKTFDERHPVVMHAIAQLVDMSKKAGIPCSICGQAPALYPEIIEQLVQWGITSISVEPEAVLRTYQAIFRAEQRLLLKAARRQIAQE